MGQEITAEATWILLGLTTAATFAAGFTRNRVPVAVSVGVAVVVRVAFAALTSVAYTPIDVRQYFRQTANLVLLGQDPLHDMPGRQWNFLELMPFVHAAELRTGLPWVYAVKIVPIIADCVIVWIVSRLASSDGRNRALQYAFNPLSLLVVALHGQVEPIALALALGGVLVLRARRPLLGGVLIGAAVAAKTWPVLILLTVLPLRSPSRIVRILIGSALVPVLCLLLGVALLDTSPISDLKRMASYSSFVQLWTWSGVLVQLGRHRNLSEYNSPLSGLSSAFMVISVVIVLILLRRRAPEIRTMAALSAVLIVTSGFGVQYLMWALPLIVAISDRWRFTYILTAGGWAAAFYLSPATKSVLNPYLAGLSWLPATLLFLVIAEQVQKEGLTAMLPRLRRLVRPAAGSPAAGSPAAGSPAVPEEAEAADCVEVGPKENS
ncbi:glycosyltransferase family 87 protein [Nakamurella sp. PAMC28650]|uniref:glycosyltransferase family 87 protein n=1 Tax=Nakamurella sp. PAMC28650 TaxID=2762325 RepID=UPI00164D4A7F|nr:glycosyltransferase family 87 protein [Nakamurella sp. PAMC28650]QNK82761.1 DUF2029 domain-containing protein [Nakamurella sp. PAMC28650]